MRHLLIVSLIGCGATAAAAQELERSVVQPPFSLAAVHAVPDAEGKPRLVALGRDGSVRRLEPGSGESEPKFLGELTLPALDALLYDFAEVLGDGGAPELVTISREGLLAWSAGEDGVYGGEPHRLDGRRRRARARFGIRTRWPRAAPFCRDINGDGTADVLLPSWSSCQLWTRVESADQEGPRYQRVAELKVPVRHERDAAGRQLSSEWESSLVVSSLRTADVNGDGREDLLTGEGNYRAWYLQDAEGRFPEWPTVDLDLKLFRDTSPEPRLKPGRVLAGRDRRRFRSGDLNQDGIPDFVISHRRKLWVFLGGKKGPQFDKPAQILKSSENITLSLLLRLDDDPTKDLVTIKVEVPSLGSLLVGALGGLSVELTASGYRARGDGTFDPRPGWRGQLQLELPPLTEVIRDPTKIIERFEAVGDAAKGFMEGDLDGDGSTDLAQASVLDRELRWWHTIREDEASRAESVVRDLLFSGEERVWDLDAVLEWLSRVVESERIRRTGDRAPDGQATLRDEAGGVLESTQLADIDGDGRDEIIIAWRVAGDGPRLEIEIMRAQRD